MPIYTSPPSPRSFGALFTALLAGLWLRGVYRSGLQAPLGWLVAALLLGLVTRVCPHRLAPFSKGWFLLGQLLGRVVSPVVLGILFFGVLTPIACLGRLFGRDPLRLKRHTCASFWIDRLPPGPPSGSFSHPF